MMLPGSEAVTIERVTTVDDGLGNTTETTTSRRWRALVAPRYANESTDPRIPPVIVGKTLYGEATVDIDADDRIIIRGVTYQVDGLPGEWPWPMGGKAGLEVPVVRASDGT